MTSVISVIAKICNNQHYDHLLVTVAFPKIRVVNQKVLNVPNKLKYYQ